MERFELLKSRGELRYTGRALPETIEISFAFNKKASGVYILNKDSVYRREGSALEFHIESNGNLKFRTINEEENITVTDISISIEGKED